MGARVSDPQMNAFVDGELPPSEATRIAEAIATDPALARRVATLYRIKAGVAGIGDALPVPQLEPRPQPAPGRAATRRRGAAAALLGAGAVAAAAALWLVAVPQHLPAPSPPAQPAPDAGAMAWHDHWLATPAPRTPLDLPETAQWMAPILQASGLQLVHVAQRDRIAHLGFRGPNSCQVSLVIAPTDSPDAPLHMTLAQDVQRAHWQAGGVAFDLVARDMAQARFATLASGLSQAGQDREADTTMRIALVQSARLRCLA